MGLAFTGRPYAVERALKDANPETGERERRALATQILAGLPARLERPLPEVPPSSPEGQGVRGSLTPKAPPRRDELSPEAGALYGLRYFCPTRSTCRWV